MSRHAERASGEGERAVKRPQVASPSCKLRSKRDCSSAPAPDSASDGRRDTVRGCDEACLAQGATRKHQLGHRVRSAFLVGAGVEEVPQVADVHRDRRRREGMPASAPVACPGEGGDVLDGEPADRTVSAVVPDVAKRAAAGPFSSSSYSSLRAIACASRRVVAANGGAPDLDAARGAWPAALRRGVIEAIRISSRGTVRHRFGGGRLLIHARKFYVRRCHG